MTADDIAQIRMMRGCNIPWTVISRHQGYSVQECRQAIGMPEHSDTESAPAPWVIRQQVLFDQPTREEVSER